MLPPETYERQLVLMTGVLCDTLPGGTRDALFNMAHLIVNRGRRFNTPVEVVCRDTLLFPVNNARLRQYERSVPEMLDSRAWCNAQFVVDQVLSGIHQDTIYGADLFYPAWFTAAPSWAEPPARIVLNDGFSIFVLTP